MQNFNCSLYVLQELYTRPPITKVIQTETRRVTPPKSASSTESGEASLSSNRIPMPVNHPVYQRPTTFHPRPVAVTTAAAQPSSPTPTLYTPSSTIYLIETSTQKQERFSSHYSAERPPFPNIPGRAPIRTNVKDLLATIGLTQEVLPTTTRRPELTPELRDLLKSFGLLTNEEPPKHLQYNAEPNDQFSSGPAQEEFQPVIPDHIQEGAIGEPKRLPGNTVLKRSSYRMNTAPELTANDFLAFKPLPIPEDNPVTSEMQRFLESFGLYDGNQRGKKSMDVEQSASTIRTPPNRMPEVSVDFLTPDLMTVLNNMGVPSAPESQRRPYVVLAESRQSKGHSGEEQIGVQPAINQRNPKSKGHPFVISADYKNYRQFAIENETDSQMINEIASDGEPSYESRDENEVSRRSDEDTVTKADRPSTLNEEADFARLQQLLVAIQNLDNFNRTENLSETERLRLRESLLASLGPDPVNQNEIVNVLKKEIKRQSNEQKKEDNSEPIRITLDLTATTEENIELTANENDASALLVGTAEALKYTVDNDVSSTVAPKTTTSAAPKTSTESSRNGFDSFASDLDPVTQSPLPVPRKNGFYFLADWNSFLEVGEDPDKVIVRFDPKIGDPSRFIPVTVP